MTNKPKARTEIRLLTCNVQRASAPRARQQAAWLADSGADVLLLTEVSAEKSGDVLAQMPTQYGFDVLLPTPVSADRYRVLVACRASAPRRVDVGPAFLGHRCVAAQLTVKACPIGVVGLYVPSRGPRDRRNQDKRLFQSNVAKVLPDVQAALGVCGPVVIAGDLNVVEPNHDPRYAVFGEWEYDFYRAFGRAGFDDAFRIKEPHRMDYSWFGRRLPDGERNGYRFDHAFVSRSHRHAVVECRYEHAVRTAGLNDHAALALTLSLTARPEAPVGST